MHVLYVRVSKKAYKQLYCHFSLTAFLCFAYEKKKFAFIAYKLYIKGLINLLLYMH